MTGNKTNTKYIIPRRIYIYLRDHKVEQQSKTICKYRFIILYGRSKIYYVTQGYQISLASKNLTIQKCDIFASQLESNRFS